MKHTIEKIDDVTWIIDDSEVIQYSDDFGFTGWYWVRGKTVFPDVKHTFLEALEQCLGEKHTKEKLPKLAGM